MQQTDLADLIASNDDNTTRGQIPPSGRDARGTPYQLVRIVAVDRHEVRKTLQIAQESGKRPSVDVDRDGYQVNWHFSDAAFPVEPSDYTACQVTAYMLNRDMPDLPVRGCVVWIGARRWWIGFADRWNGGAPQVVEEFTPPAKR